MMENQGALNFYHLNHCVITSNAWHHGSSFGGKNGNCHWRLSRFVDFHVSKKYFQADSKIQGIGAEISRELARQGASVLITYARSAGEADIVVEELKKISTDSHAKFKAIQADAAKSLEAAEKTIAEATALFDGGIDIIVNNAANGEDLELSSVTPETFDACFHPNVLFPLLLVKLSKPVLRKKARIVNISSAGARVGRNHPVSHLVKDT